MENQLLHVSQGAQAGLAYAAHRLQREAHEQGDEQRGQHVVAGQWGEEGGRDDPEQEVPRFLRGRDLVGRQTGDLESRARLDDVADQQADRQGDRRHHQEVAQRDGADLADLRGLADLADPQHDRAEDDRRDHHLDEGDERRAQRLYGFAHRRRDQPDDDAEYDRGDHGEVEVVGAIRPRRRGGCIWHAVRMKDTVMVRTFSYIS